MQPLWNELNRFLKNNNITIDLTLQNISFGIISNEKHIAITNFLIILMKFYIFGSKYRKTIPNFVNYKKYMIVRHDIEKEIAVINDHLRQHESKWIQIILN